MANQFPQRGIVMGVQENTAQVHLPLLGFDTDYLSSTETIDDTTVGKEVLIVFVNGDLNQGVIVGVIK